MDLQVRFLGVSGFQLSKGGSSILIDPFGKRAGDVDGDFVYCTHNHSDHTSGVPVFMERNPDAMLVTNHEVVKKFQKYEEKTFTANDGESYNHGDWTLEFIKGKHGIFDNLNLMVVVRNEGESFGHCGDSVTLEGFYTKKVDVLAIPILGLLTTSPRSAIEEVEKFEAPLPVVVPMHWILRSPQEFCKKFSERLPQAKCIVPVQGEILPL